jgi:cytosine/adenosine deaminase-related metal-dependent hydrolase
VVELGSVRLAGAKPEDLVPSVVFAATSADVRDVMVDGRWIVRAREHVAVDAAALLDRVIP